MNVRLVLALLALSSSALADGEIVLRGNYWRDRNTRVIAPEASVAKTLPTGTTVEAGYLLDAITSASVSAGVMSDQPFTELRHEIGARIGQRIGPVNVSGQYRYSTESDYWAHTAGGTVGVDLLQKNLSLAASYFFGHADVGMRRGALGLVPAGGTPEQSVLTSHFVILSAAQVLSRWATVDGSYEMNLLDGYQANPYRKVMVSGTPTYEVVPRRRERHTLMAGLRLTPLYRLGALRYLSAYLKYRFYFDDWAVRAHAPELRLYLGLGPTELRLTGRVYTQSEAGFYPGHDLPGKESLTTSLPTYDVGVPYHDCPSQSGCFTGDAKLSRFSSYFFEARFQFALRFLDGPRMPLGHWIGAGLAAISYGYYWNTNYANGQFGNASVGGFELTFPL